ncbi:glucose PTS transporter subunit EIIB [Niallia sp. Man26]|nr:glucose PTS transporter subunit EIIB [Niallia sp. Man26]
MHLLGVVIGNTDGGILDFIIFGVLQGTYTKWYLVLIVGAVWFAVYYFIFRYAIIKFNLKTPGREDEAVTTGNEELTYQKKGKYDAKRILSALGGKENLQSLDNCITRLRLVINDMSKIDEKELKDCGALGVVKLDNHNLQVIIGTQVASLKNALEIEME